MALKFRLRGLAETFVDSITCPGCGVTGSDDEHFSTEHTKVTYEGIIVVVQCRTCSEIFVPNTQRLGILDSAALKVAVLKDSQDSGEAVMPGIEAVRLSAEKLNAQRKGSLH
jgi:hypothetical protein